MSFIITLFHRLSRRPRFEVRAVPVLDDTRAVLWIDVPPGSTVVCRALFEFDPVPGVTPRVHEDWSAGAQPKDADGPTIASPVIVPPKTLFNPASVSNPRFRVKWTMSSGRSHESVVRVFEEGAPATKRRRAA